MSDPQSTNLQRTNSTLDDALDPWVLAGHAPVDEAVYLANGYIGLAVGADGGILGGDVPCHVRGVYSPTGPGGVDHLAVVPSPCSLSYGAPCEIRGYERRLDLHCGVLWTRLDLEEARGRIIVEQEIAVSRADRNLAIVSLTVQPAFDGEITLHTALHDGTAPDLTPVSIETGSGMLHYRGRVGPYGIDVALSAVLQAQGWSVEQSDSGATLTAALASGEQRGVTQITTVSTSIDEQSIDEPHTRSLPAAAVLRQAHEAAWEELWSTDIEIEGDPEVQQFAHAALFYLWSTMAPHDRWSIAPMGLSSNVYNGHIFWDAELWMFPSLLVTHPDLAYPCVAYREHTLPAARRRAASNGHRGAQYPWEGAFTGDEMTPHWAETRDFQLHVTADVAIGQWLYYRNTGDRPWLRDHGFPVMRECAEFWVSRVEHNRELDRYELSDVVCADEYAEHVNNDAFTNAAVAHALHLTARAAALLGEPAPAEWMEIADRMYVPYDDARGIHVEYDGYDGRRTKQADVELLAYPLEHTADDAQVARNLDFYGAVIDPDGPAMSFSIYAILSAQLGRAQAAYHFLRRSFAPNARRPFWAFSETPTNNDYFFCTGVGGTLQAILFGFSGIRLHEDRLAVRPVLPPQWTALRLRNLSLLGARTDIEIERDLLTLRRAHPDGTITLQVTCEGLDRRLCVLSAPTGTVVDVTGQEESVEITTDAPTRSIPLSSAANDAHILIRPPHDAPLELTIPGQRDRA
jgi:trehalose/maltose hydrolase-like predicted phosphorylase